MPFTLSNLSIRYEELENNSLQHESSLASLRQKHNTVIADLGDQIDTLNKSKAK